MKLPFLFKQNTPTGVEVIKSQLKRTQVMAACLSLLLVLSLIEYTLFQDTIQHFISRPFYWIIACWILLFLGFELVIMWRIRWFCKRKLNLPEPFKYIYSCIEVSFPSALLFFLAYSSRQIWILDFPSVFLYFIAILLSALHLNYKISLWVGLVAALQYILIVFFIFQNKTGTEFALPEVFYYVRGFIILLFGCLTAFVSRQITNRLEDYFTILKTKADLEVTFGQQVSEEIAQTLLLQGQSARQMDVTILALDIRDFTVFARQHTPNEILAFQNKLFSPIIDIIRTHQGVVNQILGDGLMATFGAPVASIGHPQQAFSAACQILALVEEMNKGGYLPQVRLGIGMHSGEVITGNIGSVARRQYSISGTPVIIAFRLEQLNKEYQSQFLISKNVQEKVTCHALQYLGRKTLKGLEDEIEIFKVC